MSLEKYESHLVGQFLQLWGRREGVESMPATILNNAQNPFDHWFGDICGEVRHRYFLIEFKQTRDGFAEEAKPGSKKTDRTALYQHLRSDESCRKIARVGHFAAYQEDSGVLAFEPYAHSIAPLRSKMDIVDEVLNGTQPWSELDYRAWTSSFTKLYDALHESDLTLYGESPPWLFKTGLGIPVADLEQYVSCMYSHINFYENDKGLLLLGSINPANNELKAVALSPFQMVSELKVKFERMRLAMAEELADEEREKRTDRDVY